MLERYAAGESMEGLATRFDVSRWTIHMRLRENGVTIEPRNQRGTNHFAWRGGRHSTTNGYVVVWVADNDPMAPMRNADGYVLEHRLVMARSIDRPLTQAESVHHIDGDKANNAIENLQLRRRHHGNGQRMVCLDCGSHNVGHANI